MVWPTGPFSRYAARSRREGPAAWPYIADHGTERAQKTNKQRDAEMTCAIGLTSRRAGRQVYRVRQLSRALCYRIEHRPPNKRIQIIHTLLVKLSCVAFAWLKRMVTA